MILYYQASRKTQALYQGFDSAMPEVPAKRTRQGLGTVAAAPEGAFITQPCGTPEGVP
jgi:hypothetical protein